MLPFIIAGLTTGSVYALAGVGLVLTYRTSGVFNLAHGALATVSAYAFYTLHETNGVPWPIAAFLCVFVIGPLLGLAFERGARRLTLSSLATRVVATIGVLLLVQAIAALLFDPQIERRVEPFLPAQAFDIAGTAVTMDRVIVFAIGAIATAGLWFYLRVTRTGLAMRAVVDDAELLDTSGTNPVAVRRWSWVIGVTFASASGLLLTPFLTLNPTTLTFLVVAAFGAAAIGSFRNLPLTYLGGLLIGVGSALASKYFTSGWTGGLSASLPFLALFVVLLVSPRGRLAERTPVVPRNGGGWTTPWQIQALFGLLLVVFLVVAVPGFAGVHLGDFTRMLALSILFLSLGLLVRTSGQVSLCHVTFMVIGAAAFAFLNGDLGWPWPVALIGASLFAVPIGALLAIPAIRLSGLYLALATFGFGILVQYMFYKQEFMFGVIGIIEVNPPVAPALGLDGTDKGYYFVVLCLLALTVAFIVAVTRSRLGRLLSGLADSPIGLATGGTSVNITRVLVFCISAFLAAMAGILDAGALGAVGPDSYQPLTSLTYYALIIITVGGAPWYAIMAAAGFALVPSYFPATNTTYWLQIVFGVTALAYAMTPPHLLGTHPRVRETLDRLVRRSRTHQHRLAQDDPITIPAPVEPGDLLAQNVRVAFGGLVALADASVHVPTGRITGLIGPNGAGKTTFFNACSGLNKPSNGTISMHGANVSGRSPSRRARLGLGRTFQQMELFDSMSVWENVALGAEARRAGFNPFGHVIGLPSTKRRVRQAADNALRECDLIELADRSVGSLSTGQRRLVELARCLAGDFRILLLDEPSSGLDRVETARFGEILRRTVDERGVGILLVEHDMALVTQVCDYIYVLDFGVQIFEGTPDEVLSSPVVQAAYLGEGDPTAGSATTAFVETRSSGS